MIWNFLLSLITIAKMIILASMNSSSEFELCKLIVSKAIQIFKQMH